MNGRFVDGDTLVVTFAPRATEAGAIWGSVPLQRLGHSVLCFVDFADAWFPSADMAELKARIAPKLAAYRHVVTYGHSMGGYGALKYGRLFSAARSVGLGPAWSVAPQDIGLFDRRRPRLYYRPELHDGMAIRPADLADEAIVVFDPHHAEDSAHLAAIEKAGCDVKRAYNYFVGHDLLSPCLDGGNASGFVREIANGAGVAGLRNTIRASRSASPRYVANALASTFNANRGLFARRLAERHALPLADKPQVRAVLVQQDYAVPELPQGHDWRSRFESGTFIEAVTAAQTQDFDVFLRKAGLVRRWLLVHAQANAFDRLSSFVTALIEFGRWRGDEYTSFAHAILKGGRTRAHYAVLDPLLLQAAAGKANAEKLAMISLGADLMLRGETRVPSSFFSSAYFTEAGSTDALVLPPKAGEFVRSLAIDLPPGGLNIAFDIRGEAGDMARLSANVLRKNGHSLQSWWHGMFNLLTPRGIARFRRSRGGQAPAISVRVPVPKKRRETRVNIILKTDGSGAGDIIRFHGVHIVRV